MGQARGGERRGRGAYFVMKRILGVNDIAPSCGYV